MGAVIVNIKEVKRAMVTVEVYSCNVRRGNGDLRVGIGGNVGIDEYDGSCV